MLAAPGAQRSTLQLLAGAADRRPDEQAGGCWPPGNDIEFRSVQTAAAAAAAQQLTLMLRPPARPLLSL